LANKYLATQVETSKAACDELRLKNAKLSEELNQALVEQRASQRSQELLLRVDAMQPLRLVRNPLSPSSASQGNESGGGDEGDGVNFSSSIAGVFAPTAEDIARREAAAAETKRREEERAMLVHIYVESMKHIKNACLYICILVSFKT
jgi:hypothetical protein